jgi:MscS family membrane protein
VSDHRCLRHRIALAVWLVALGLVAPAAAQVPAGTPAAAPTAPPSPEAPKDVLGRSTPRGTVIGFLGAARKGEDDLARQYLNTRLSGNEAETLAHQLFVVLDARLPARLTELSDTPEGSRANPASPGLESAGTIQTSDGPLEIMLERVERDDLGPIWLISRNTLNAIPSVFEEITMAQSVRFLPAAATTTRVGGIRVAEWILAFIGIVLLYLGAVLLNRLLNRILRRLIAAFRGSTLEARGVVPAPARVPLVAVASRWLMAWLPFSLLMRQFWTSLADITVIVSATWLLVLLIADLERHIRRRIPGAESAAASSLLRIGRRVAEALVIVMGMFAAFRYFGIDPTPALAGLGVGGIAVALAAQKTLENVIAGASLIFDEAVKVGDFLKMGTTSGTVVYIGLRSTRIRTLERTIISVPNSQIANASLETMSARDRFCFNHVIGVRYETTMDQMRAVLDGIRQLLLAGPPVDSTTVRVRFIRLGASSLDIEAFAYIDARDWPHFLEVQEQLLFSITEIVERAGTAIAFPSQTMYMAQDPTPRPAPAPMANSVE